MTILGTRSYAPLAQTAFPRPYVVGVRFRFGAGATFDQDDGDFYITDSINPWVHVVCNFLPTFWVWDNNGYTLDHIIKDWWLILDPDPTPQALNFGTELFFNPADLNYWLAVGVIGWTTEYDFALPPAPLDYWRPGL